MLTDRGEIFAGCNVENASYGLTICAERNAIFQAVAQRLERRWSIRAVVVFTPTPEPTAPCGACRQVINEFGPDAEVISVCDGPATITNRLDASASRRVRAPQPRALKFPPNHQILCDRQRRFKTVILVDRPPLPSLPRVRVEHNTLMRCNHEIDPRKRRH